MTKNIASHQKTELKPGGGTPTLAVQVCFCSPLAGDPHTQQMLGMALLPFTFQNYIGTKKVPIIVDLAVTEWSSGF